MHKQHSSNHHPTTQKIKPLVEGTPPIRCYVYKNHHDVFFRAVVIASSSSSQSFSLARTQQEHGKRSEEEKRGTPRVVIFHSSLLWFVAYCAIYLGSKDCLHPETNEQHFEKQSKCHRCCSDVSKDNNEEEEADRRRRRRRQ